MNERIAFIGYRGTGKSAVAEALGKKIKYEVFSIDSEVEKIIGMSISEFVSKNSWEAFRDVESSLLKEAIVKKNVIIDCGGGIVERSENCSMLQSCSVVWLKASVPVIVSRIAAFNHRPSLTGKSILEEVEEVLQRRSPLYKKYSNYDIQTDDLSIPEITNDIVKKLLGLRIAVGITSKTVQEAVEEIVFCQRRADLVELRLDYINDISETLMDELLRACAIPQIVTVRKKDEGGFFNGSEDTRISLLVKAAQKKATFVDIEYSSGLRSIEKILNECTNTKLICSYHHFQETPEHLEKTFDAMAKTGAHIIKIACMGNTIDDYVRIVNLIKKAKENNIRIIALLMGKYGKLSRVTSGLLGSYISTYAPIRNQKWVSGQLTYDEVIDLVCSLS